MVGNHDRNTQSEDERAEKYWDDLDKELLGPDHERINANYWSLVNERKDTMIGGRLDIPCKSSSSGKTNKSNKGKKKSKKKSKNDKNAVDAQSGQSWGKFTPLASWNKDLACRDALLSVEAQSCLSRRNLVSQGKKLATSGYMIANPR